MDNDEFKFYDISFQYLRNNKKRLNQPIQTNTTTKEVREKDKKFYKKRILHLTNNLISGIKEPDDDINIIFGPVVYACLKYLSSEEREKYLYIFEIVSASLNKLKLTYAGNEIVYNIEQIKNVIDSFISKKDNDISLLVSNYNSNGFKIKQNIYDHINSVWTHERKQILLGYIHEIKTFVSHEYENELILSLSSFLNCMDITTKNIINNI